MQASFCVNLTKGEEIDIPWGSDLQIGLGWDIESGKTVDLDASAVLFSDYGVLLDAVFYNQQQTKDRSMIHSGDNKSGVGDGDDERITIITSLIHPSVKAIAIVVNAYRGGDFSSVRSARAIVRDLSHNVEVVNVQLPNCSGHHHGLVLAVLYRNEFGQWRIRNTYKKARGRNFKESEYKIRKVLKDRIIPEDLLIRNFDYSNGPFNLEKNQTFILPNINKLLFGLGWDVTGGRPIDLDGSVISFDKNGNQLNEHTIYFGNKTNGNHSIEHSGDNLTGDGDGDDEQVTVQLSKLPSAVHTLFFCVNIYTLEKSFSSVSNAYVRVVDPGRNQEICRFLLADCGDSTAVLLTKVFKDNSDWKLTALGDSLTGRTWRDVVPRIKEDYLNNKEEKVITTKALEIEILSANNLAAMDAGGTSDPYVHIITDSNQKFKTPYIKKTLNPVWNHSIKISGNTKKLVFEVYDKDTFKDDLIGFFKVDVEPLPFNVPVEFSETILPFPQKKAPGGGKVNFKITRKSN